MTPLVMRLHITPTSPAHARTRSGKISEVYTLVRVCQERGHQDEERLGGANRTGGAQEPVLARR